MSRTFLIHPKMPPVEVVAFDKDTHWLVARRPDGGEFIDPNFWIYMAKRCGYSLTAEVPLQFQEKRHV